MPTSYLINLMVSSLLIGICLGFVYSKQVINMKDIFIEILERIKHEGNYK